MFVEVILWAVVGMMFLVTLVGLWLLVQVVIQTLRRPNAQKPKAGESDPRYLRHDRAA